MHLKMELEIFGHKLDKDEERYQSTIRTAKKAGLIPMNKEDILLALSSTSKGIEIIMSFKCSKGHIQLIAPDYLVKGIKCSECDKSVSGTYLRSLEKLANKHDVYLLTRIYTNCYTEMHFMCTKGHIRIICSTYFKVHPSACVKCSGKCKVQAGENFIKNVANFEATVLGNYMGAFIKVRCMCKNQHLCWPVPSELQRSRRKYICRRCSGTCPIYTEERFFEIMVTFKCDVRGKYYNNKTPIYVICQNGHHCHPTPLNILTYNRMTCVECSGNTRSEMSEKRFDKRISDANFTPIEGSKYNGSLGKVKCKCPAGHPVELVPSSVQQHGVKCKICDGNMSFLEMITMKALDILGIDYKMQVMDSDIMLLRFDFMFVSNEITYYIEVDGIQHQEFNPYFHGTNEGFVFSRQRDLVKNYVVLNSDNLRLIRLPHTMFLDRKPENREKLISYIAEYIREAIQLNAKIVIYRGMYPWINDEPDEEYQYRYMKSKQKLICPEPK